MCQILTPPKKKASSSSWLFSWGFKRPLRILSGSMYMVVPMDPIVTCPLMQLCQKMDFLVADQWYARFHDGKSDTLWVLRPWCQQDLVGLADLFPGDVQPHYKQMTALHSGKEKTLWWSFTGAISIYWTSDMWVPRVYVQGTTTADGQSVVSAIYPFIKKKKCDVVQEIFQLLNFKERIRRILGDPVYPNPVIFLGTPFQEVLSRKSLAP